MKQTINNNKIMNEPLLELFLKFFKEYNEHHKYVDRNDIMSYREAK